MRYRAEGSLSSSKPPDAAMSAAHSSGVANPSTIAHSPPVCAVRGTCHAADPGGRHDASNREGRTNSSLERCPTCDGAGGSPRAGAARASSPARGGAAAGSVESSIKRSASVFFSKGTTAPRALCPMTSRLGKPALVGQAEYP